jgi:hypothetical protein
VKKITIKSTPHGSSQVELKNAGYNSPQGIFGMWGKVIARHSEDHTVDMLTDRGFEIRRIPVASRDWVTKDDLPTGGRDLPPEDTYVFMIMPTGQIESAFIIASGFPHNLDALKDDFLVKDKESEAFSRKEGGWQKTYDKSKGDLLIEDKDGFSLSVKKSDKAMVLTDWNNNKAIIDQDGIVIEDANSNKATLNSDGVKVEDKNGNVITTDASGINIKDKSSNEVQLTAEGATIKTINGKITGGSFKMTGVVAAKGTGPFCAILFCPITGLPHCGDSVVGT